MAEIDPVNVTFTPLHIKLLLHYHCNCDPWPQSDAPAVSDYTQALVYFELVQPDSESGSGYITTERGKAHIKSLLTTPLPRQAWVNESGRVISQP